MGVSRSEGSKSLQDKESKDAKDQIEFSVPPSGQRRSVVLSLFFILD
jgi:hypothetical protein